MAAAPAACTDSAVGRSFESIARRSSESIADTFSYRCVRAWEQLTLCPISGDFGMNYGSLTNALRAPNHFGRVNLVRLCT